MGSSRRSVLVVEDDPSLLVTMHRHLVKAGLAILTASDFATAVAQLGNTAFDAVYVDLCLPNESGYELCERIRQEPAMCFVPIIVASERGFPEDMSRAEEAGANAFLRKPFTMQLLIECLEMLMGGGAESRPPMRRLRSG
jgi:DNA-binding response OmpR family regulator